MSPVDARPRVVAGLRLLRRVGSGGEGEVWEARDRDGARKALKLIRPEFLPSLDELARRGRHLRRIDHPALVRVHRSGRLQGSTLDGWGFLEMDFVDGEPMGDAPADPEALERLEPLAEALDALHAGEWSDGVPLVHRDVKPANLIARPDGEVVLVDCSTLRGTDATQLTRIGTPVFAAPEVMQGRVGPAADVYSFGVTIVALVTGARGEDLARLLADPETLDLPDTVRRALSPDPAGRPGSCRAVLDAGTTIDPALLPPLPPLLGGGSSATPDLVDVSAFEAGRDQFGERPEDGWGDELAGERTSGGWASVPEPPSGVARESDEWWPRTRGRGGTLVSWLATLGVCAWLLWQAAGGGGALARLAEAVGLEWVAGGLRGPVAAVMAAAVHLVAVRLAGQGWGVALLAPPAAWGWLLGERTALPGPARAWTRATVTGTLAVAVAVGLAAGADAGFASGVGDPEAVTGLGAVVALAVVFSALACVAGRHGGAGRILLRLLLAPAWLAGTALLVAAGLVGALLALPAGRPAGPWRLVSGTLAGAGAFAGLAGAGRDRQPPDPRG